MRMTENTGQCRPKRKKRKEKRGGKKHTREKIETLLTFSSASQSSIYMPATRGTVSADRSGQVRSRPLNENHP
jgi:hypothetical protein